MLHPADNVYIVSLNVLSSSQLELGYKTVGASAADLEVISSLQKIILDYITLLFPPHPRGSDI